MEMEYIYLRFILSIVNSPTVLRTPSVTALRVIWVPYTRLGQFTRNYSRFPGLVLKSPEEY